MLRQLIDELRGCGELEWIEFKVDYAEPQMIGEYLSALSNGACLHDKEFGYLVFGIDDKTREMIGTTFKPRHAKGKGNEDLEPWLARLLSPRVDFRIFDYDYDGKSVVLFRVDATINTPVNFSGIAYIRVGETKQPIANYPEKERKIWSKKKPSSFESGIALENQLADEVLSKIDYPGLFELLKLPLPDNRNGILENLIEEKVILKSGNGFNITNLGAILFAKNLSYFESLNRKCVRVIFYKDDSRLNALKEQPGKKGYAVGFEGLVNWICDQLPTNEIIKDALRVDRTLYPKVAIREFVANAIIHQDFSVTGSGPMIEIFKNRIEFTNPGKSLIDTDRFIDHAPRSRNEILASLMRRMNICEERGSGIDRAIVAIETYQLPSPEFHTEEQFTRVTLFASKEFREMDKNSKIRACYQHCCLRWVSRDFMSNATLRERFGIKEQNYPTASRIISDTLKSKFIKVADPENKSNKRKYVPYWA